MIFRWYVFRNLFVSSLWSFLLLTAVLFAGLAIQFTNRYAQLGVGFLFDQLPGLLAMGLPYSVAFGVLSGATLTVGRMASEREMVILSINGVPPRAVWGPAFALAVAACGVAFAANFWWQPHGHQAESRLAFLAVQETLKRLPSGANAVDLPNFALAYQEHREGRFAGVTVLVTDAEHGNTPKQLIVARFGSMQFFADRRQISILFEDCFVTQYGEQWPPQRPIRQMYYRIFEAVLSPFEAASNFASRIKAKDFGQLQTDTVSLRQQLRDWQTQLAEAQEQLATAELEGGSELAEERAYVKGCEDNVARTQRRLNEAYTEFNRRVAMGLAPLLFIVLGVPMGMLLRHGNRLVAFAASVVVVATVYYPLLMVGRELGVQGAQLLPGVSPYVTVAWMPSLAILVLAAVAYQLGKPR